MTLKDIDYILELAQTQNFNRAAENLYTAQPTLSYHIKSVETELGFQIFTRSGKGASLTPAGAQFCVTLRNVRAELKKAIEQAQNFSARYAENITIGMAYRTAVYHLPEIIKEFARQHPTVSVTPVFSMERTIERFLKGETDIIFAMADEVRRVPDVQVHPFYESGIYLISRPDDPLAKKDLVTAADLAGRTLMVGGGSPPALRRVQQRVINAVAVDYFNSADHDTTLTNVAAGRGICLAPGFLNDGHPDFVWTPFDCEETIPCVLCTHREDARPILAELVKLMQTYYREKNKEAVT